MYSIDRMVIQNIKVVNDRGRNESNHMKATGEERETVRETDELLGGSRGVVAVQVSVSFTASPLADVIAGIRKNPNV